MPHSRSRVTKRRRPAVRCVGAVGVLASLVALSGIQAQTFEHTHGFAVVRIAMEERTASIDFLAPAVDIYGFEGEPRTPAQRERRARTIGVVRDSFPKMLVFDPELGCSIIPIEVHAGNDSHAHDVQSVGHIHAGTDATGGRHVEVHGDFLLRCARPFAGQKISVEISRWFPSLTTVDVVFVTGDAQRAVRLEGGAGIAVP